MATGRDGVRWQGLQDGLEGFDFWWDELMMSGDETTCKTEKEESVIQQGELRVENG